MELGVVTDLNQARKAVSKVMELLRQILSIPMSNASYSMIDLTAAIVSVVAYVEAVDVGLLNVYVQVGETKKAIDEMLGEIIVDETLKRKLDDVVKYVRL